MLSTIRRAIPLVCAAALLACADATGPVRPTAPPSAPPSASLLPGLDEFLPGVPVLDPFVELLDGDGVVEWARGGGHITFMDARRTFAFTAKNKSDGTTQGQFQLNNRAEGLFGREHGVVTCLRVDGNVAWVGGYVTQSDIGTAGISRVWRVTDNGEGSSNDTDLVTLAFSFGPRGTEQICQDRPPVVQPDYPVEDGNIQVKDASP